MIKLAIGGYRGRMGQRLEALAADDERFAVVARYDLDSETEDQPFDVLIDFSAPSGTMAFLSVCKQKRAGLLVGCTGHSDEQNEHITRAAGDSPVLVAYR